MDIIKHKKIFLIIGAGIVIVSALIVAYFGLKPGIDFTGGSLMEVTYATLPEKAEVESAVAALSLGGADVRQSAGDEGAGYLINTRDLTDNERQQLEDALLSLGTEGTVARFTSIGPVIGAELADKAVWAIGAVLLIILCYVAFAFAGIGKPVSSWIYGFLVTLILGHDILVPVAAMSILGFTLGSEVDILFVTALLTILGYSVNDTIVIFDRVREKLVQNRTEHVRKINEPGGVVRTEITHTLTKSFADIVGQAVDETMARSINTSLTVFLALASLYIFGSEVTRTFVLVLMVGVLAGAYSSIFIASPLLVAIEQHLAKKKKTSGK
ncbi:MAG: protein translocase subunit SecF [Patescibacteria group bacterium]